MDEIIRFGLGGPESMSTVWLIWATGNSDVYASARALAGDMKFSLHHSGVWRWAFTQEHQAKGSSFITPEEDRAQQKWPRPREFAPGLTRALAFIIPASEVRAPIEPYAGKGAVSWIPVPPDVASAVHVDLFLGAEPLGSDGWPRFDSGPSDLLWACQLAAGEWVYVVSHVEPMADELRRDIEKYRAEMLESLACIPPEQAKHIDPRGYLLGTRTDGVRVFVDVALPAPTLASGSGGSRTQESPGEF